MKYILILLCYLTVLVHGSLLGGLGGHHHHHHDHNMTNHDHMHSSHDHNHDHMSSDHNHDHMSSDHMHEHLKSDHMNNDHMSSDHMHDHDHMKSDHMKNDQMPNHDHKMQDNDHHHQQMQDQGSKSDLKESEMEESNELEVTTKRIKTKKKNGRSRTGRRFGRQRLNSLPFNFRIPKTGFSCKGRAPGYYADMEADCTVYHMCNSRGGGRGFLCPQGTRFNQRTMVCDFAKKVKCNDASDFFHRNVIIHQASLAATKPRNRPPKPTKPRKQLRKLPRLTEADIITIKRPQIVRAKSNGRMSFAPLFEKERTQKMKMLKFIMKTPTTTTVKPTTTMSTTTSTTTTATTITTERSAARPNEDLLGLPELPNEPSATQSPLFQIRVHESAADPKSIETDLNPDKWQLIPPVQASKSIVRFRVDPEQPILSLKPPAPAAQESKDQSSANELSPFQLVGHVMSEAELKSFPDSPMFKIKGSKKSSIMKSINRRPKFQSIKRTGKQQSESLNSVGLPVQLGSPGGGLPGPLVWISPASLARSPMVNLRHLPKDGHHAKPANVEKTLTMVFPGRQRRRFELSCLTCLSQGGNCPHCLVV